MIRIALLLLFAAPAAAQTSALRGLDTSAPIDFDAGRIEVQDAAKRAILTGDVAIRQGRMTLNADQVNVLYSQAANGDAEMRRLDARGNVVLTSPSERATGNSGIYDVPNRLITLLGNVTLNRDGNIVRGQRLVLNLATGQTSFDARGGATQPGQTPGRVTGRFVVPQRNIK